MRRDSHQRASGKTGAVQFPERENHAAAVELVCDIGTKLYAFEHTGIEPFAGHVRLQVGTDAKLKPIEDELAGNLPATETFRLHIPASAMEALKGKALEKAQRSIVQWIKTIAPSLPVAPLGRYITPIKRITLPDAPFEVSLHRCATGGAPSRFQIDHLFSSDSLENERLERIREAYIRKVPKLAAWQRDAGARSVLILEENDIQLTNSQVVADAVAAIERTSTQMPDEIYLVSTVSEDVWWIWAIRIDNDDYYTLRESDRSMTEVSPNTLVNLTAR